MRNNESLRRAGKYLLIASLLYNTEEQQKDSEIKLILKTTRQEVEVRHRFYVYFFLSHYVFISHTFLFFLELAAVLVPSPKIESTIAQDSPRVRFEEAVLDLDESSFDGSSDCNSSDSENDSDDDDNTSCEEEDNEPSIPFASLSVTESRSNMGKSSSSKKKKGSSQRYSSSSYSVFESLSIDDAPTPRSQIIDGSVQTLYKGLYKDKDMGYHVLFLLEVPASITKKRVFAEVIDDGMTLAITTYYSLNLLHHDVVMLEAFGNFSRDSTGAESWRNSCDEITHQFPTDRIPNYVVQFPLITQCRMDPSDIQVKVQPMIHHDEDQRDNGQNEVYLFVKLRSVAKVHEKNEVEDSNIVADISTIAHGIPAVPNQQLLNELDALKQAMQAMQNQQQQQQSRSSSSSYHHGMSQQSTQKPFVNQNEMTYRRNTTSPHSVPTLQDPLESGSRKGAKSIIEMSSSAASKLSSKVASTTYNSIGGTYYSTIKNLT